MIGKIIFGALAVAAGVIAEKKFKISDKIKVNFNFEDYGEDDEDDRDAFNENAQHEGSHEDNEFDNPTE